MPSIIRFVSKASARFRRKGVKFNRRNVYLRDRGQCQYCGIHVATADFTQDHVLPRGQGGRTTWENIVTCCIPCNQSKGMNTPAQAGMRLLSRPAKPKKLPGAKHGTFSWTSTMPLSWKDYCGSVSYWTDTLES